MVEYLANECLNRNKIPLILSRGYGDDERYQYQWNVPEALVGIGANRVNIGNKIMKGNNNNKDTIAILDDGFQTWHVERDIDIVCINCLNPFSNEEILPLGMLREPLSTSLHRATHILFYNVFFPPSF